MRIDGSNPLRTAAAAMAMLGLLVGACSGAPAEVVEQQPTTAPVPTPEPTATPVPTPEPTATPVPTPEPTATPVPTPEPTATPVPTATPASTPTPAPTPTAAATTAPAATATAAPGGTATPAATAPPTESMGAAIFRANCARCHSLDGSGSSTGRSLIGIAVEAPVSAHINSVTNGLSPMPAFGGSLTVDQIAAVVDYVRTSF